MEWDVVTTINCHSVMVNGIAVHSKYHVDIIICVRGQNFMLCMYI